MMNNLVLVILISLSTCLILSTVSESVQSQIDVSCAIDILHFLCTVLVRLNILLVIVGVSDSVYLSIESFIDFLEGVYKPQLL
jgi:hypothetical protein